MRITTLFFLCAVVVFCTLGDEGSYESTSESDGDNSSPESEDEGKGIKPECDQYKQDKCPKNVGGPICGTNNKDYSSECALCLENQKTDRDVEILKYGEC